MYKFTRFYEGIILSKKFGVDKRRAHLSRQSIRRETSRFGALNLLRGQIYPSRALTLMDIEPICKKLLVSEE